MLLTRFRDLCESKRPLRLTRLFLASKWVVRIWQESASRANKNRTGQFVITTQPLGLFMCPIERLGGPMGMTWSPHPVIHSNNALMRRPGRSQPGLPLETLEDGLWEVKTSQAAPISWSWVRSRGAGCASSPLIALRPMKHRPPSGSVLSPSPALGMSHIPSASLSDRLEDC